MEVAASHFGEHGLINRRRLLPDRRSLYDKSSDDLDEDNRDAPDVIPEEV
jgi:hypothetical protein